MIKLHPFLQSFRDEHAVFLATQKANFDCGNYRAFFDFARQNIRLHAEREELILLPAAAKKAEIRVGGPSCLLFFGMHCNSPPLERASAASGRKRLQPTANNVPEHLRELYLENSPACIPLEDHFALAELVKAAETCADKELSFLALTYFNILKLHIDKEDNCLLPMCQSLLTSAELDELSDRRDAS